MHLIELILSGFRHSVNVTGRSASRPQPCCYLWYYCEVFAEVRLQQRLHYPKLFIPKYPKAQLTLKPRDLHILWLVGSYKYMTGSMCAHLMLDKVDKPAVHGKPTGEAIKRAMYKLFHAGYLTRPKVQVYLRHRQEGSHEMIYTLTTKGRAVLEETKPGCTKEFLAPSRENQIPFILHTLMVGRFRAAITQATKQDKNLELLFWKEGKQLATTKSLTKTRLPVIPDAFFGIKLKNKPEGKNKTYFFLEADRSTMTTKRFTQKLQAYETLWATKQHTKLFGIKGFRVLTITRSKQRRDNLRELAKGMRLAKAFWFGNERDFEQRECTLLTKSIWVTGRRGSPKELFN